MNSGFRDVGEKIGKNTSDLVDGNGRDDGGKLYPLMAKQIHGSNPTKLHHTNKSQKKLGLFLWGIFELGTKSTKTRLATQWEAPKS